jgi:hypothetical protein
MRVVQLRSLQESHRYYGVAASNIFLSSKGAQEQVFLNGWGHLEQDGDDGVFVMENCEVRHGENNEQCGHKVRADTLRNSGFDGKVSWSLNHENHRSKSDIKGYICVLLELRGGNGQVGHGQKSTPRVQKDIIKKFKDAVELEAENMDDLIACLPGAVPSTSRGSTGGSTQVVSLNSSAVPSRFTSPPQSPSLRPLSPTLDMSQIWCSFMTDM